MAYRKGDRVSVEGIIKYDQNSDPDVAILIDNETVYPRADRGKMVSPAFKVGDNVVSTGRFTPTSSWIGKGKILAIHDGYAWIETRNKDLFTILLSALSREED